MSDIDVVNAFLADKTYAQLEPNYIDPQPPLSPPPPLTAQRVQRVIVRLKEGRTIVSIKQEAKDLGVSISFGQIRLIKRAWLEKLVELTPEE